MTGPSERGLGRAIFKGQDDFMDEVRTSSGEVELTEFEPRMRRHPHSSSTSRLDDSYAGTREGTCFPRCSSICLSSSPYLSFQMHPPSHMHAQSGLGHTEAPSEPHTPRAGDGIGLSSPAFLLIQPYWLPAASTLSFLPSSWTSSTHLACL